MPSFESQRDAHLATSPPVYHRPQRQKFKRIAMASFLCAVAACILVSLIGLLVAFTYMQVTALIGIESGDSFDERGLFSGAAIAVMMSAMNWYVGYITVPAAWLALGLSLGRFPRRGIFAPMPYYRWGMIWGSILVGATTAIASALLLSIEFSLILGAGATGAAIGAIAGGLCAWLFLAIVRPAEQNKQIDVSAF